MKSPSFFGRALQSIRKIVIHEHNAEDLKIAKMLAGPTGASSDVPSDGGFLIAPERSNVILQRMYDTGAIASLVTRQPIGAASNGIVLPAIDETSRADGSRYGGVASAWVGQGTTTTAGKPKFRAMELKLKKLLAFVYGTDELIVDAAAFSSFVNRVLPLELLFRLEDAVINGDGSNKPQGILNAPGAITVTRNTATRVLYEDVSAMWKRMWAPLRSTAVWIIDQSVEQELEQISIAIGTAGVLAPIYRPAGISVGPNGTQGYSPATLYGRPILTTEYNAALGTVGDIILTNLSEYTLIDKGGVDQAVSLHVAFLTDEQVWRFTYRADGQSNWNAALTPKSGGSTLSAVVTLT
jgi:HK97 family phage major capsid protein